MPTSFTNLPDRILFSSELRSISVSTDVDALDISVSVSPGDTAPLFAQTLWAYAGRVQLSLADILQARMMERAMAGRMPELFSVTVSVRDHERDIHLLSSTMSVVHFPDTCASVSPTRLLASEFLTPSRLHRVPRGKGTLFFALISPGEAPAPEIRYVAMADDGTQWASRMFLDDVQPKKVYFMKSFNVKPADIIRYAALNDEQGYYAEDRISLLSATLTVGPRTVTVFYDPELDAAERFDFRNRFLAPESFFTLGPPRRSIEFRRQTASVSGQLVQYGPSARESFMSRSHALTDEEFGIIHDLLDSPVVTRQALFYDDDNTVDDPVDEGIPVVVTEAEPVYDTYGDEPPVAEITWRYAADRRALFLPDPRSRFSGQYDSSFF